MINDYTLKIEYKFNDFVNFQAIIVSLYAEPVTAEQCAVVTEKLGDYLISVGYWGDNLGDYLISVGYWEYKLGDCLISGGY